MIKNNTITAMIMPVSRSVRVLTSSKHFFLLSNSKQSSHCIVSPDKLRQDTFLDSSFARSAEHTSVHVSLLRSDPVELGMVVLDAEAMLVKVEVLESVTNGLEIVASKSTLPLCDESQHAGSESHPL
ncbi:hypothetical protein BgiBS90_003565 [Biomphalaria glabrata]|nr:hypothetical protein BgiBS90_003565 [Biomphalaria glabrata]